MSEPSPSQTKQPRIGGGGIRLGRVFGVALHIDWSLLIIFALITVELAIDVFPGWHPSWHPALSWGVALAAAVLFFASVMVHELSHAVVARMQGIPVSRITLFLFGGVTQLDDEPESPKAEFWMAIVGPLTSAVIGLLGVVLGTALGGDALADALASGDPERARLALAQLGPVASSLLWLGPVNIMLAIFNVIPGFPLDGGRVLRSILWAFTDDLRKATRWAARVGQLFAWTLMALGAVELFTGALASGLWMMLIGWFLNNAARASYEQLLVREALEGVPVRHMMRTRFARVRPELSVAEFVRDHATAGDQIDFPVEADGRLLGVVGLDEVADTEPTRWDDLHVGELMVPASALETLSPDTKADRALAKLVRGRADRLLVMDHDHLLGLLRRRDLVRWLRLHERAA